VDAIFEEVRKRCSPATWSRGVELTRLDAITGVREERDEVVLRVATRGGLICPTVTLFLDDRDWDCSCGERACEHAAAAVIALRKARAAGKPLPAPAVDAGHVGYRLSRSGGAIALTRVIAQGGTEHPLDATLASASGRTGGPAFAATAEDLTLELALGTHRRGVLPPGLWAGVLPLLARSRDVTLDGAPLKVSREPVGPVCRLEDQGDGFRLSVGDDPGVTERFHNGVALCGGELRPTTEAKLSGRELHELPQGKHYPKEAVAELVTEVLPSLRARIRVEVLTERLPGTVEEPPRIVLDVKRDGIVLAVLPTLVYGDPPRARVDGRRLVPLRDGPVPVRRLDAEQRLARQVQARIGLAPGVRGEFTGEEAVAVAARIRTFEGGVRGDAHEAFRIVAPIVPRVRVEGDRFDVVFESLEEGAVAKRAGSADPADVIRAWRNGDGLVPLLEGGYAPLPAAWLAKHGHLVADLLAARDASGRLPRSAAADLLALCDDLGLDTPADFAGLRALADGFERVPPAALPSDLVATLRPYQREGVDRLAFLRDAGLGALLADDMGLGKTLQALCAIRGRTLVVCPTSVLHNWKDEIARFRPALRHAIYHGASRAIDASADVTLTTYAILRLDEETLAAEAWDTLVLDEAQNIKNPDSQVTGAAWRLPAQFRLALTGTPVENRLEELWSQFHFLNRGLLGARDDFDERYARPIAAGEPGAAERLRRRIRPFVLRRLKRDVAPELPPRTEAVLYCELTAEERAVYDAVRAATVPALVQALEKGGSVLQALEALLRLRQAACHPGLVPGHSAATSAKVARLLEVLDTVVADGHKALVFSQWTSLLDRIEPHLVAASLPFVRLDGATRDRGAVVAQFQDEAGPPVMLVSLKAGGTGLNLTAADHVILLDPWWNPAVEDQAADRAHRIGQERPVLVYRLVAEATVEERILALQQSKRALADAAIGDAERAAALTRDDILALLQ